MKDHLVPTLDLFSGIGGFSYALSDICRTIGYCEIDLSCQQILRNNIRIGHLKDASIFADVTRLQVRHVPPCVRMIVAGSPCQDISVGNTTGVGLTGPRSSLIWHVFRLAAELPKIHTILLENSSNLKPYDLKKVLMKFYKLGFNVKWGVFSAADVGAPHLRRRWFCLATKNNAPKLFVPFVSNNGIWDKERNTRLIARRNPHLALKRCSVLGNSVVPQVVRYALATLCDNQPTLSAVTCVKITMKQGKQSFSASRWGTPCKTITSWYHYNLTRRSACNMANQLFYDTKTPALVPTYMLQNAKLWMVNPQFVEWIMGYPTDYTVLSP